MILRNKTKTQLSSLHRAIGSEATLGSRPPDRWRKNRYPEPKEHEFYGLWSRRPDVRPAKPSSRVRIRSSPPEHKQTRQQSALKSEGGFFSPRLSSKSASSPMCCARCRL